MIHGIPLSCSLQLQKPAAEHNEEIWATFRMHMGATYQANQLVFVDETGVNHNTSTCRYGWASYGDRACCHDFFVCGTKFIGDALVIFIILIIVQRYSVLPALALEGILHVDIQQGTYMTELFNEFISSFFICMNLYPGPWSLLVMDNAPIHKSEQRTQMCCEWYV